MNAIFVELAIRVDMENSDIGEDAVVEETGIVSDELCTLRLERLEALTGPLNEEQARPSWLGIVVWLDVGRSGE